MRSFASVILHILAPLTPRIVLLDEPEAFLHPPQARLLGEIIATERRGTSQLFVATHSPDVVYGLLNVVENDHLRIIRLERVGNENRTKELDPAEASQIASDPLMKYSSVLSGVFHQRVIVCESDADCMFYGTLLDLPNVRGPRHPDVLFIHPSGKHRMAVQAKALRSLGVPVDVIADMDVINDVSVIKGLFEALGGDWSLVEAQVKHVIAAIEERHPPVTAGDVARSIQDTLHGIDHDGPLPKAARRTIQDTLRDTSPWSLVKKSGEHGGIPSGTPNEEYRTVRDAFESVGLWLVPVGELEGFCRNVGGHGSGWVQSVIEQHDLEQSPDLEEARAFVRKVWKGGGRSPPKS